MVARARSRKQRREWTSLLGIRSDLRGLGAAEVGSDVGPGTAVLIANARGETGIFTPVQLDRSSYRSSYPAYSSRAQSGRPAPASSAVVGFHVAARVRSPLPAGGWGSSGELSATGHKTASVTRLSCVTLEEELQRQEMQQDDLAKAVRCTK
ncbi:hypothetical protein ColLi_12199 [Colletotrichum liriopes]|uniref:Uncharacterized protein n=1 Tax=Colletotrichum liriopes TaxID=708192 RepID=A0AA37GZT4_9PEZI|nr:hypothetical protein ColLi_12199 [Colletotrichum liriopes]